MSASRARTIKPARQPAVLVAKPTAPTGIADVTRRAQPSALAALLLATACFVIYLTNLRLMGPWDTIPARWLPISILREGNLDLDEFPWLRRLNPEPYFLVATARGHFRSRYPIALPLLVTPLYAPAVWWLHHNGIADDDVRLRLAAVVMERVSATAIASASVAVLFLALCRLTRTTLAAGISVVYALGTNTWSTSSQALYQHGCAELALAGLSLCFLSTETRRTLIAAGVCAAFGVLVRPTMVVFALVAALFAWRERPQSRAAFLALTVGGGVALLLYNVLFFGRGFGGYAEIVVFFRWPNLTRLTGLLISPSRGLFIYTPAALLAIPQMVRWRTAPHAWLRYAAVGVAGYLLLYTSFSGWWAGYSYGPRFLIDALPALALLAAPTVERLWSRFDARILMLALAAWGIVVQLIGVYCDDMSWDAFPVPVDRAKARLWDWSDPQILRAWQGGSQGTQLAGVLWQAVADPRPVALREFTIDELVGSIRVASAPSHWRRHERAGLDVVVTNGSTVSWPAFSDYGMLDVQLMYTWWRNNQQVADEGGFVRLPRSLGAGESADVHGRIDTPAAAGNYDLDITVAQLLDVNKAIGGRASVRVPVRIE